MSGKGAPDYFLFHGHAHQCPYTVEGDWSVCDCGALAKDPSPTRDRLARWAASGHEFTLEARPNSYMGNITEWFGHARREAPYRVDVEAGPCATPEQVAEMLIARLTDAGIDVR